MSGVKRYIPEGYTQPAGRSGTGTHMVESRDGDYVLASDYDALAQRCLELEAGIDQLRAEVERFREGLGIAQRHRDELQAEVEALRKDAARYRWLRDTSHDWYIGPDYTTYNDQIVSGEYSNHWGSELDSAIDAAMRNEQ